jgi:myb proto-oncogene protein
VQRKVGCFILFRWVNHLNPKINKEKWTIDEERKIFEAHKVYGNKWKMIAKQLNSRTDNSIKNHFYSILRKGLRRINKMMGDRKSTEIVKEIRTSVLSKLDNLDKSSAEKVSKVNVSKIYELLFQFSSMNSGNISEKNLTLDMKNDFKEVISHLMELSSMEKIKKEKNIAMNKDKRNIKNSANKISESSAEIEL